MSTKILCDHCKTDLTTTRNSVDWRLCLKDEAIPTEGGTVTDMMIHRTLGETYHFCGMECLREWLRKGSGQTQETDDA